MAAVTEQDAAVLRIGELSRRVGVSDHVLRAWESRYGLLDPVRSAGGFRLYSEADERRVRRMQAHLGHGLSAAQAARVALAEEEADQAGTPDPLAEGDALAGFRAALRRAFDEFDEPAAQAALDRVLTDLTVETALRAVVLPYLQELGERWERGSASVAQEHFASNVIRGRLSGLARGWGQGQGPWAVLACPPEELHELALIVFGVVLHRGGWRVRYLGASTPLDELTRVVNDTRPALVALAATSPDRFTDIVDELARLAATAPLVLAGAGATPELADRVGARPIGQDPVTAAEAIGGP